MPRATHLRRLGWALGLVLCLLTSVVLGAEVLCPHCAQPSTGTGMAGHEMTGHEMTGHEMTGHEMESPDSPDDRDCCGEGACPSEGEMDPGAPELQAVAAPSSSLPAVSLSDVAVLGDSVTSTRCTLPSPDPGWGEGPPLFLLVAAFLL